MLSSVAVLSDIHGVLPALDAVLAEPDLQAADAIVVTGDIAAGPQPVAVLDRLTSLTRRVILVRGNADRELVQLARGGGTDIPDPIAPWAAAQLRPDQVELLAGLPHPVTLAVSGFGDVLFCHGSPRDDEEVVLVDTRLSRWAEALDGAPGTVVCGHTHMPFVRLVRPAAGDQPRQRRHALRPGRRALGVAARRGGAAAGQLVRRRGGAGRDPGRLGLPRRR